MDRPTNGRVRSAPTLRATFGLAAALALLLAPVAAPPVRAAEELRLTVATSYTLDPADHAIHVVMDITATNLKPNRISGGIITSYYYNELSFGIQEEAAAIRATSSGRRLTARTAAKDGYQALTVRLARNLNYRQTQRLRITFDLPGGAPRSDSDIRVGEAFSSFYAWAWGDAGRSSVSIVIPKGFEEDVNGSPMVRSTDATTIRLAATAIAEPDRWYVTVDAERPEKLTKDLIVIIGGAARLNIRAWPEDAEWRTKVHDLMERGLPILQRNIGLDWPVDAELGVYEVHTPLLEGYAGVYYTESDRIEIGEDLDDRTIIHEASHAWFNSDLFSGRWISEGFADEYASRVLEELRLDSDGPETVSPSSEAAVRLNAWRHPGRIDDEETDALEAYGYNASWTTIRGLVDEIGVEKMREVIGAADSGDTAYPGRPAPEKVAGVTDWRRFLDLLEEVGGSTKAEGLFRRWVTEPYQDEQLDDRAAARTEYARLVEAGDGWLAPYSVRSKMGVWDFIRAGTAMDEAETLITSRESIESRATGLGVTPTAKLKVAYESAKVDLKDARALANEQLASLDALVAARETLDRERDPFVTIGLIGSEPEAEYNAAKAAFEGDDLAGAVTNAADARAMIDGAPEVGRTRVVTAGAAAGGVFVLGAGTVIVLRRRRRTGDRPSGLEATRPYATLPGDPVAPAGPATPLHPATPLPPAAPEAGEPGSPERGDEPPWSSRP